MLTGKLFCIQVKQLSMLLVAVRSQLEDHFAFKYKSVSTVLQGWFWKIFFFSPSNNKTSFAFNSLVNIPNLSFLQMTKHISYWFWLKKFCNTTYIQFIWSKDKVLLEMQGHNHIEAGHDESQEMCTACNSGQSERPYFLVMVFWMKVQYLKKKEIWSKEQLIRIQHGTWFT